MGIFGKDDIINQKWFKLLNIRNLYQGVKWKGLKQSNSIFGKIIRK